MFNDISNFTRYLVRLEFELIYKEAVVQHFSHYTSGTLLSVCMCVCSLVWFYSTLIINAKSIFIHINNSILNNSVQYKYSVWFTHS